jgi:hypothetical protein
MYFRRLLPNASLLFLVFGVIAALPPSRIKRLFHVPLWRSALFVAIVTSASFAVAAFLEWSGRRKLAQRQ